MSLVEDIQARPQAAAAAHLPQRRVRLRCAACRVLHSLRRWSSHPYPALRPPSAGRRPFRPPALCSRVHGNPRQRGARGPDMLHGAEATRKTNLFSAADEEPIDPLAVLSRGLVGGRVEGGGLCAAFSAPFQQSRARPTSLIPFPPPPSPFSDCGEADARPRCVLRGAGTAFSPSLLLSHYCSDPVSSRCLAPANADMASRYVHLGRWLSARPRAGLLFVRAKLRPTCHSQPAHPFLSTA